MFFQLEKSYLSEFEGNFHEIVPKEIIYQNGAIAGALNLKLSITFKLKQIFTFQTFSRNIKEINVRFPPKTIFFLIVDCLVLENICMDN